MSIMFLSLYRRIACHCEDSAATIPNLFANTQMPLGNELISFEKLVNIKNQACITSAMK